MRYLGIDYGSKRVGIALSDESETFAFPKGTVANDASLLHTLLEMVKKEGVGSIIVGDARSFSGRENPITKEVEAFASLLKEHLGLPVELSWEAGSSVEASRFAPEGRGHDDSVAAAVILQRYLDTK